MNKNFTDNIISKIKERGLHMRPRWHFALQTLGVVLLSVIAFVLAVFLLSWVYFILHANGAWLLPAFGQRGWLGFARSFPALPAIAGLVLLMVLALVLEKFRWAYRLPLLYVGLGVLGLVAVFSLTVAQTPFHREFYRSAQKGGGLAGPLYRGYGHMPKGEAYVGTAANVASSTFEITTQDGEIIFVSINERTRLPFGFDLAPDDTVMVMGDRVENMLTAFGLREIGADDGFFDHPRLMRPAPREGRGEPSPGFPPRR